MHSNNNPLVSVIIPAYNHEQFVQETILSIIKQTYQNIELIIIDDGSKDDTWKRINKLRKDCEKRFVNVIFEAQNHLGICETLNKLISFAQGNYVYIIASDDLAKSKAIETEIAFLEKNPDYVLVVGDNEFIDASSNIVGWNEYYNPVSLADAVYKTFGQALQNDYKKVNFNSSRFGKYETFVTKNYIPNGYLIKKSALEQIENFTKEAPLEDWWMHLQLSKIGKYKYINEILFSYRQHENNTIKRKDYMYDITQKTQLYEKKLVSLLKNKKWQHIFEKNINRVKMKFNLFNIIKFYSIKNINFKQLILEICRFKIVIKTTYNNKLTH